MREIGDRLVIASHNAGKVREIADLLRPFGISVTSAADFDLPVPEETETTFVGNARIKALAAARATGLPALSDDSGISVDALDGAPGVYTADWAETGGERDFTMAMARVHRELQEIGAPSPWTAAFHCVLCLAWPDGETAVFPGRVDGEVVWPMRGDRGFGFDPVFLPKGETETFAEMAPERKHAMSHRADAFRQLKDALLG